MCAVIAAGVLASRGGHPAGADNPASPAEAPGISGLDNAVDGEGHSDGQLGLLEGETEPSEEGQGQSFGTTTVPEVAANLVHEYEQRGNCVLVRSGYLDLSGKVWSMVVEGSGWVDVCIVQRADDGTCETKVMHMDAAEWAASLDGLGLGG